MLCVPNREGLVVGTNVMYQFESSDDETMGMALFCVISDSALSPSSTPHTVEFIHPFVVISYSLMAFELRRPYIDALETQLYRTVREGNKDYAKL